MLNNICLVGRLVHNAELKATNSGKYVTTFAIAVERNRSGQDGQRLVDYIDIVARGKAAEFVCKYFQKGSWVAVDGRLQTRTYEDQNGNKRKIFEVVANNVNFCGSRNDAQNTPDPLDSLNSFEVYSETDDGDLPF